MKINTMHSYTKISTGTLLAKRSKYANTCSKNMCDLNYNDWIYIYAYTYTHTYTHIHIDTHTHTHTRARAHTHTHAQTHYYIHTHFYITPIKFC